MRSARVADLHGHDADTTAGPADVHRFSGGRPHPFDRDFGHQRVHPERDGRTRGDTVGKRDELIGGHRNIFGVSATRHRHCENPSTEPPRVHAVAEFAHHAGDFESGNETGLSEGVVVPLARHDIDISDAGGLDTDEHFTGSGSGVGNFRQFENIGATELLDRYCFHSSATFCWAGGDSAQHVVDDVFAERRIQVCVREQESVDHGRRQEVLGELEVEIGPQLTAFDAATQDSVGPFAARTPHRIQEPTSQITVVREIDDQGGQDPAEHDIAHRDA